MRGFPVQVGDDLAHRCERFFFIGRVMIGDSRLRGVHIGTAQLFGGYVFADSGFHQRRPGQENRAVAFDDDAFVAHGRDVCSACRAGAEHSGNLRNTRR